MIIHRMEQGTDEWSVARSGKITASAGKTLLVLGKPPLVFGVGAYTYMRQIVEERITGIPKESFTARATDFGHTNEPLARAHYERINFIKVDEVGFIEKNEWIGMSPDGLVGDDGGAEFKCLPKNHSEIIDTGTYKSMDDHIFQCQFSLWCTDRKWWDLCFFHPNYPENIKMKTFRITPDKLLHKRLDERTGLFIAEAKAMKNKWLNI